MTPSRTISRTILDDPCFSAWLIAAALAWLIGWENYTGARVSNTLMHARYLAGLTVYSPDNIYAYSLHQTTVPFHGLLAVWLKLGFSEVTLSQSLCALTAMLHGQAFAMIAFAMCRRADAAVAVGVVMVYGMGFADGADYPLNMLISDPGAMAFGATMSFIGFVGLGWRRAATATLVGLGLLHPVMALIVSALSAAVALKHDHIGSSRRLAAAGDFLDLRWLAGGLILVAAAWLAVRLGRPEVTAPPPADPGFLESYYEIWDDHRNRPVNVRAWQILGQSVIAQVLLVLALGRLNLAPAARRMTLMLLLAGIGGIALWSGFHLLREHLPMVVLAAMPNRLLNLAEAPAFPLLAGLALVTGRPRWGAVIVAALLGLGLFSHMNFGHGFVSIAMHKQMEKLALIAAMLVVAAWLIRSRAALPIDYPWSWAGRFPTRYIAPAIAVAVLAAAVYTRRPDHSGPLADLLGELARSGAVAVADEAIDPSLLPIRMPIVINTKQLDYLPYVPAAAPVYAAILKDVYGVDFFRVPVSTAHQGALSGGTSWPVWRERPVAEWQEIRRTYGVDLVIASPKLKLKLEPIPDPRNVNGVLYRIP